MGDFGGRHPQAGLSKKRKSRSLHNRPSAHPQPVPYHPQYSLPYITPVPSPFRERTPYLSFPIARFPLPAISPSDMESQIKTRKPRTRKPVSAQIETLKKTVSVALKAAWNVDMLRARREKAVRKERGALEKKLVLQREALLAVKEAVESTLLSLEPVLDTTETSSVAPITPEGVAEFAPVDSAVSEGLVEQVAV